jgi:hypothetical protein
VRQGLVSVSVVGFVFEHAMRDHMITSLPSSLLNRRPFTVSPVISIRRCRVPAKSSGLGQESLCSPPLLSGSVTECFVDFILLPKSVCTVAA